MSANAIPVEAKEEALRIIARFNQEVLADSGCSYVPRFKGKYLYLDREDSGTIGSICRLEYNRRKGLWEFAIYKYSDDCYDPARSDVADHLLWLVAGVGTGRYELLLLRSTNYQPGPGNGGRHRLFYSHLGGERVLSDYSRIGQSLRNKYIPDVLQRMVHLCWGSSPRKLMLRGARQMRRSFSSGSIASELKETDDEHQN